MEDSHCSSCRTTCRYAGDGDCDDGGEGAEFSVCSLATDCDDCGERDISLVCHEHGDEATNPNYRACAAKIAKGADCNRDEQCLSSACKSSECVECESHSHCPENQYCDDNMCKPKLQNGAECPRDDWCSSGVCTEGTVFNGYCRECTRHSHCPDDKYCTDSYTCTAKLSVGKSCTYDSWCRSDVCKSGKCVECESQSQCPADNEFCKDYACVGKLSNGAVCSKDYWCESNDCGSCSGCFGLCGPCYCKS